MQTDREREHQGPDHSVPFPIPATVPVFALPNVVLFPKTYLPLHIFEPRYREMVDDAVMGGQCIGMALLKEGWESDYYGKGAAVSLLLDMEIRRRSANAASLDDVMRAMFAGFPPSYARKNVISRS